MNFKKLIAIASLFIAPLSHAAYVTINEAGMDKVYSQANIDIRIGALTTLAIPSFLDIDIDTISACGSSVAPNIIGCGQVGGPNFVVESSFAADTDIPLGGNTEIGVQLLSHELGHNLGLQHRFGDDLMNPFINGFDALNSSEIAQILASPLVHTDTNGQRYIQINPVLIAEAVVHNVPEPGTLALVPGALVLLAAARRRKRGA